MGNQLMGRTIPEQIASLVLEYHKKNGTSVYLNSNILSIQKINNGYQINFNNIREKDHIKISFSDKDV